MNSTQLSLRLDWGSVPWEGRSPRHVLTMNEKALFLRREPQKDDSFFIDADQYDMFRAAKKRPLEDSPGAPSLLPLPKEWR